VRRDTTPGAVHVVAENMPPAASRGRYESTTTAIVARLATRPGSAASRGAARLTSRRLWWTMSWLCS
jgi:hypothetical protein